MTLTPIRPAAPEPAETFALTTLPAAGSSPARDRATKSMGGISRLFDARPELRGVHAAADLADDAIRWSA